LLNSLGEAICDVALLHDADSGVARACPAPGEIEDKDAAYAEDNLCKRLAKVILQFELLDAVFAEFGVR